MSLHNHVGKSKSKKRHIRLISRCAQCSHRGWSRVRVRGGDRHAIDRNPRPLRGEGLRSIDELFGEHAAIRHDNRNLGAAIIENDGSCLDVPRLATAGRHASVDVDGELLGGNVDHRRTDPQFGSTWPAHNRHEKGTEPGRRPGQAPLTHVSKLHETSGACLVQQKTIRVVKIYTDDREVTDYTQRHLWRLLRCSNFVLPGPGNGRFCAVPPEVVEICCTSVRSRPSGSHSRNTPALLPKARYGLVAKSDRAS